MDQAALGAGLTQEILIRLGDRYASMFVRIWQPAGQSRGTVYCLHGFAGNGADFDYLATFLCRNGYLVICPDLLGRGRSAYLGGGYDIDLYSRCLRALSQFAGKENHFIGTSWGGLILILFLHANRGRVVEVCKGFGRIEPGFQVIRSDAALEDFLCLIVADGLEPNCRAGRSKRVA